MMRPKGLVKYTRRIESIVYRLFLGDGGVLLKKLMKRIKRWAVDVKANNFN